MPATEASRTRRARRWARTGLRILFGVLAGSVVTVGTLAVLLSFGIPRVQASNVFIAIAIFVLAHFAAVAIHETAHLVAAAGLRMRIYCVAVGPLLLFRSPEGRLSLRWLWRLAGGGFTGCVFADGVVRRARLGFVVAAGPLGSFALAVVSFGLLYRGPSLVRWSELVPWFPSITFTLLMLGWYGFFHFVFSMVPMSYLNGLWVSDGGQLLRLVHQAPALAQWRAVRDVGYLAMAGVRPRDWPAAGQATRNAISSRVSTCSTNGRRCTVRAFE